jgi:hypothetical protein
LFVLSSEHAALNASREPMSTERGARRSSS